jgi:hypothetical protein
MEAVGLRPPLETDQQHELWTDKHKLVNKGILNNSRSQKVVEKNISIFMAFYS